MVIEVAAVAADSHSRRILKVLLTGGRRLSQILLLLLQDFSPLDWSRGKMIKILFATATVGTLNLRNRPVVAVLGVVARLGGLVRLEAREQVWIVFGRGLGSLGRRLLLLRRFSNRFIFFLHFWDYFNLALVNFIH